MTAWFVTHNEQIMGGFLTLGTIALVCLGYFWWEVIHAAEIPAKPVPVDSTPYNWAGVVDVEPWDGHTP